MIINIVNPDKSEIYMNRYTVLVQADKLKKVIPIPAEFEHKELEVIIKLSEKKNTDINLYNGIFHMTKEEIDRDISSIRDAWNINEK